MIDQENKVIELETRLMHSIINGESDFDLTGYKVYRSGLSCLTEVDFDADVELIDCNAYNVNLGPNIKADENTLQRNTKKTFTTDAEMELDNHKIEIDIIVEKLDKKARHADNKVRKYLASVMKGKIPLDDMAGALSADGEIIKVEKVK